MNSFVSRIGGKRLLSKAIISRFPSPFPERYIEVFGGAGWVMFALQNIAKLEVFNDIDGQLINLFRCVKYHCEELQKEIRWSLNSREIFLDFREQERCRGLTDIQRAARYFVLIKESYGSDARSYGCSRRNLHDPVEYLSAVQDRLRNTVIESRDFEPLIKTYDRAGSLFYLDPPYHGTEGYYPDTFSEDDHKRLAEILKGIKGRFVLSYNDDSFIRELYSGFSIEPISRQNSHQTRYQAGGKFKELLIMNY